MVSDDISRRAAMVRRRHLPVTLDPTIPVAEGSLQRRFLLPLLAAVSTLILGGCDFGGDEDEDEDDEDGDD
jgi:hypothetical protein